MLKVNDIVKVKNMPLPVLAEDHKTDMRHTWGIFVEVEFDGHTMEVPLYMLEIQEEGNHTFGLRDYALWHTDEYIPEHMGKLRGFGSSD
jgi:hypothetical protein